MDLVCNSTSLADAWLANHFCAFELPIVVNQPRSIVSVGTSDAVAVERGTGSVVYLADTDGDGIADTVNTIVSTPGLNHGLALYNGYLYASRDREIYRWSYSDLDALKAGDVGTMEVVIDNINADGQGGAPFGHTTRTLAFNDDDDDDDGNSNILYVSVGSNRNVDPDSFRSRIRRFDISDPSLFPIDFLTGEVFADGLRNEVGLAFDKHGILWGVENGADNLHRTDLGGDIHNDNPGEELNRFPEEDAGKHWGYPYCFSEFFIDDPFGQGAGTVWAWPSFLNATAPDFFEGDLITDETCRDSTMTSELSMQAHSAPLGITFYNFTRRRDRPAECDKTAGFPKSFDGYAFIAHHGSWNRDIPTGYKIVYVQMDENGRAVGKAKDLLKHTPPNARWPDGFRPVDLDFDDCGRLLVTSDGSRSGSVFRGAKVIRIEYEETPGSAFTCFSGQSVVKVQGKGEVEMKDLVLGDKVLAANGKHEPVYSFGDYNSDESAVFLQICTAEYEKPLELTPEHMVFVERHRAVPALLLNEGDSIMLSNGNLARITSIQEVERQGLYGPLTLSGTIVVDGFVVSTFVALQPSDKLLLGAYETPFRYQWLAHLFESPVRLMYHLGLLPRNRTPSGMPNHMKHALDVAEWLLGQQAIVQVLVLAPIITVVAIVWMIETLFVTSFTGVALLMALYAGRSFKKGMWL